MRTFIRAQEREKLPADESSVKPKSIVRAVQLLCIVEHIAYLTLEGVVYYVKRIRQARYRQANKRWTESDENNIKHVVSNLTIDLG